MNDFIETNELDYDDVSNKAYTKLAQSEIEE
jgi:hypothetical protein